jgi:exopolysaccharide biosynthesis polyprenyl glycosylphosphotransferase
MEAHTEPIPGARSRIFSRSKSLVRVPASLATRALDEVALRDRRTRRYLALADAASALVALVVSIEVIGQNTLNPAVLLGLPLVVLASKLHGLYERDELVVRRTTLDELPALFQLAAVYTLTVWMLDGVLLSGSLESAQALILWAGLCGFGLTFRRLARSVIARASAPERLLLIGDARTYLRLAEKLETGRINASLVGRMSLQRVSDTSLDERHVDEATLSTLIGELNVHRVLVVPSTREPGVTHDLVRGLKATGVRVSVVPRVLDVVGNSFAFDDICGLTILGVKSLELSRSSRVIKRTMDVLGAGLAILLCSPLMIVIAVLIKLDSPGPVFFRQERIGRDGRGFRIFKFRTMVADAEARKAALGGLNEANGLFKIAKDPRVTRVGRLLRSTSLDELPQLLNVLQRHMSLVGPRPLILSEDQAIVGHDRRRLALTPGMTGPWQIQGSARVPMHEMVKLDYLYVSTWTMFEDFKIMVRTISFMVNRRGV